MSWPPVAGVLWRGSMTTAPANDGDMVGTARGEWTPSSGPSHMVGFMGVVPAAGVGRWLTDMAEALPVTGRWWLSVWWCEPAGGGVELGIRASWAPPVVPGGASWRSPAWLDAPDWLVVLEVMGS